ncbi:TonB-dependent receptor plug domain-containing protein [Nitrincola nitratireducens]
MAQTLLEAPSSVTIIDKETIEASGAQHLVDILRLVPGFQASTSIATYLVRVTIL